MLAKNNEYLQEAASSIYIANAEEIVRQQCLAREDAERRERTLEHYLNIEKQKNAELEQQCTQSVQKLAKTEQQLASTEQQLASTEQQNQLLSEELQKLRTSLEAAGK